MLGFRLTKAIKGAACLTAAVKASISCLLVKVREAPQELFDSQARCNVEAEKAIWIIEERLRRQSSPPLLLRQASWVWVRTMVQGTMGTTSSSQSLALHSRERIRVRLRAELGGGRRVSTSSLPPLTSILLSLMLEMAALFRGREREGRRDVSYM